MALIEKERFSRCTKEVHKKKNPENEVNTQ